MQGNGSTASFFTRGAGGETRVVISWQAPGNEGKGEKVNVRDLTGRRGGTFEKTLRNLCYSRHGGKIPRREVVGRTRTGAEVFIPVVS